MAEKPVRKDVDMLENDTGNGEVGGRIIAFIERIESLEETKREAAEDIKEVYSELKGNGLDPTIIREIVKIRALDADGRAKRREREEILDLYKEAIKMED